MLTVNYIQNTVRNFRNDLDRAQVLYDRIAMLGGSRNGDGSYRALRQPDRRDAAQFIFFEAAAQFESFCRDAFMIEVRHNFGVQPKRAQYLMGNIDRALTGVMGWGAPKQLQSRAQNLFGRNGFFSKARDLVGQETYLRLVNAHKIRNRIAHSGGAASRDFNGILAQLQVPAESRRGLSVGRLLMDYPSSAQQNDRWFHRLIAAYGELAEAFEEHFVAEFS